MKKSIIFLAAGMMCLTLAGCNNSGKKTGTLVDPSGYTINCDDNEDSLVVYGGCEEPYLKAVCTAFGEKYGIDCQYVRLSSSEIATKIKEENGHPSADVLFGGTNDPYNVLKAAGLLEPYAAQRASHIKDATFKDPENNWYGIYKGVLGLMWNTTRIQEVGISAPTSWEDLVQESYVNKVTWSNPSTAGTAKKVINTLVQIKSQGQKTSYVDSTGATVDCYDTTAAMEYFKKLNKNTVEYTKSGSGASKQVGKGECIVGIGFLHDVITQIVDNEYDNIGMCVPSEGTAFEIGCTAILKGCQHPNLSKAFIEFALSPECVELAAQNGSYQFLVIDDAQQPKQAASLADAKLIDFDWEDEAKNSDHYVEEYFKNIDKDHRFKTA